MRRLRVPGILSDIDGVLRRGGIKIPGSKEVVESILAPFELESRQIKLPFSLLTNGGGVPECERAMSNNICLGIENEPRRLGEEHMIECHTPFSGESFLEKYGDQFVVVSGLGRMIDIAELYGYKRAIDLEELFAIYPHTCPSLEGHFPKEYFTRKLDSVMSRFQNYSTLESLKADLTFSAFFLLSDAVNIEMNVQIMCDLAASKDGRLDGGNFNTDFQRKNKSQKQYVDLFISNPDLEYADKFIWNRHGQGIILESLYATFEQNYPDLQCDVIYYGKPMKSTFDFAKARLIKQAEAQNLEISRFYMIGDNPLADIKGGNDNDCESVLVRTGVWSGQDQDGNFLSNDLHNPASYVAQNMKEAYEIILEKEGLRGQVLNF